MSAPASTESFAKPEPTFEKLPSGRLAVTLVIEDPQGDYLINAAERQEYRNVALYLQAKVEEMMAAGWLWDQKQ